MFAEKNLKIFQYYFDKYDKRKSDHIKPGHITAVKLIY